MIKLDVISDPICPWCYIGKRRFETAVEELRGEVEVDLDRKDVLLTRGLVQHRGGRVDDQRPAHAPGGKAIHVEDVALELRRRGPRDGQFRVDLAWIQRQGAFLVLNSRSAVVHF